MSVFGVWMWPQSISDFGAGTVVERCARAGITDIYFLAKGLAGTASFRSGIVPMASDRDLLGELLKSAHGRGIRVHAWLTSASDEHYKAQDPLSGRFHYTRGRDKGLISLTDEGYLAYMEKVVRELCRSYDIDGLHLDYIRYNHLIYGWSGEDRARYAAAGADIDRLQSLMDRTFIENDAECIFDAMRSGDTSAAALADVRRRDVRRFAETITGCARAERQDLILSAALMPEGAYDDTTFADLHYGQSYEDAAALYDFALPMAYSKAYDKDGAWVREVALGTLRRNIRTIVGLHAYEGGTGPGLRDDADALADIPVDGICLFREGAFAMAFAEGKTLRLANTMNKPVTAVAVGRSGGPISLDAPVLPGEEACIRLSRIPDVVRAFSDEGEVSVWLSGN